MQSQHHSTRHPSKKPNLSKHVLIFLNRPEALFASSVDGVVCQGSGGRLLAVHRLNHGVHHGAIPLVAGLGVRHGHTRGDVGGPAHRIRGVHLDARQPAECVLEAATKPDGKHNGINV